MIGTLFNVESYEFKNIMDVVPSLEAAVLAASSFTLSSQKAITAFCYFPRVTTAITFLIAN